MRFRYYIIILFLFLIIACDKSQKNEQLVEKHLTAEDILGNPNYLAISYGGYRKTSRDSQPSIAELKEDLKILDAAGVKILRTYNVHYPHASNILKAIRELKSEVEGFEMYVMLGAWIDCKNAWTENPDHSEEDLEDNTNEINKAVELANQYPDIVKILAVGNEAMVHWAWSYWVEPKVILKWVNFLQDQKKDGNLPKNLWITSSDNFASWGGGDESYQKDDLTKLIKAVDYISMHTYPMHDTHYNPTFWGVEEDEIQLTDIDKIDSAMTRARDYAVNQYNSVKTYINSLGINKPIHIGETGWASFSNELYGDNGSHATDEYKQALYYKLISEWASKNKISCFYFEAFDEIWKDSQNPQGSENNFGLFTLEGKAKYALWPLVDQGVFDGLTRNGNPIIKTYGGDADTLIREVKLPPQLNPASVN